MIAIAASLRALASYEAVGQRKHRLHKPIQVLLRVGLTPHRLAGTYASETAGRCAISTNNRWAKGVRRGTRPRQCRSGSDCEGPVNGDDRLQALWVFSADACGVYGLPAVHITHAGKTAPIGVITLRFEKAGMKLDAYDAFLIRVVSPN